LAGGGVFAIILLFCVRRFARKEEKMAKIAKIPVCGLLVLCGAAAAEAAVAIDPAGVLANASSVNYQLEAIYSCNAGGLAGDLHTNDIGGEPPAAGEGTMWLSNGIAGEWIEYRFDAVYPISSMWVWNYNQVTASGGDRTNRGINRCTIEYSADGTAFTQLGSAHFFARADGSGAYAHNTEIPFGGVLAKHVRITVVDNHGGSSAGLSEVRFYAAGTSVQFESASSGASEAVSFALLNVVLSEPHAQAATVDYHASGGTATEGVDYELRNSCICDFDYSGRVDSNDLGELAYGWLFQSPGAAAEVTGDGTVNFRDYSVLGSQWQHLCQDHTLAFEPGRTARTIGIAIAGDGVEEQDETIIVQLSNPTGDLALGPAASHTYTIAGGAATVSFESDFTSGEEGFAAVLPVSLSAAAAGTVTVDYAPTGGTATGDSVDYLLAAGTLTFEPGRTTQGIFLRIREDSLIEENETIFITLSNPVGAALGAITQHTYRIIDNEAGVWFDEMRWYHSSDGSRLNLNAAGELEWDIEKEDQLYVRLPEQSLDQAGEVAEFKYWWKSSGQVFGCDCSLCPGCFDDDIGCVAGTGDFRIGLFEADGEYITDDGMGVRNSIFSGYKGYRVRMFPNADSSQGGFYCLGEAHSSGSFDKRNIISANGLLDTNNDYTRMRDIKPFGAPPDQFSPFTLRLQRLNSTDVKITITLNGITYSTTDGSSTNQPRKIDVFAIYFPNARPYDLITFKPYE
jgi:hypothetical protein